MILMLVGAGGAGAYLYHTGAFISPVEINANISSALSAKGIQGVVVNVGDDRVAKLSGTADDAASKYEAGQVARSVKGVKDVLENLEVLPSIADTEMRLSKALKDQQLTDILVKIDPKRTATLIGNVTAPAMIELATKAATATPGVKSVVNQIQVVEMLPAIPSVESPPVVTARQAPRPPPPSTAKSSAALGNRIPAPIPAVPVRPVERKRTTCEGLGGFYLLSCSIEGPEQYFKCAPDGKQWNNAIPGCDRGGSRN